jgi:hypothetical protein
MTPFWPELPIEIGVFQDFKDPMRLGRMPQRLGGRRINAFSRVLGYVGYGSTYLDNQNILRHISGQMGPWSYWREPFVESRPMGLFDLSGFGTLFNVVSSMKFEMLFGDPNDQASLHKWEYDYDAAHGKSWADIQRTWWESVSFDARYVDDEETKAFPPPESGEWTAKKWEMTNLYPHTSMIRGQGHNPWPTDLGSYTRATQSYDGADPYRDVWYKVSRRRTAQYPQLGIFAPHPPVHEDGSKWPYTDAEMRTYWHVSMRRFNGAELTPDTTLHRNYMPPLGEDPDIGPTFLTDEGDNLVANIESRFTFNGYAYRDARAKNWAQRFINPNPTEAVVCYAQARVSNPVSWDLFTQAWRVKLMRTQASYSGNDRWAEMLQELNKGVPSQAVEAASQVGVDLDSKHIKPVLQTVESYTSDFVKEVTH